MSNDRHDRQKRRQPQSVARPTNGEPGASKAPRPDVPTSNAVERHRMIEVAAYYLAERRGFSAGGELEDWLNAESEIDRQRKHGS